MADSFPADHVREALTTPEVTPWSAETWAAEGSCFAAVGVAYEGGWAGDTVVFRSDDSGASWRMIGRMTGNFGGVVVVGRSQQWVWSNWQSEGTFSTIYRTDGEHLFESPGLDAPVRARGGCCFTGVDAIVATDRQSAVVQVHGFDDVQPGAPNAGWFETTDGGQTFAWLGVDLPSTWKRAATDPRAPEPAPKSCSAAAAGFFVRR